jgi:myo-inositol-1(or 4)-monophosphatase
MKLEMIENPDFNEELKIAIEAAREAGKIIDQYQTEERIEIKERKAERNDFATEADFKSEKKTIEIIEREFPDDGIIAEEGDREEGDRHWIIDPLDGTSNYQKNYRYYCVSIALEVDGETQVGVVYSPETARNQLFFAVKGEGSYKIEDDQKIQDAEAISPSKHSTAEEAMVLCQISPTNRERREMELDIIEDLSDKGIMFRKPAACALSLSKIAEGRFDGTIEYVYHWDYAAGALILEEAGGSVRIRESKWGSRKEVIGTNGKIQEAVESTLEDTEHDPTE